MLYIIAKEFSMYILCNWKTQMKNVVINFLKHHYYYQHFGHIRVIELEMRRLNSDVDLSTNQVKSQSIKIKSRTTLYNYFSKPNSAGLT